ncbi:MAG: flagellar motor switch protein FliG [Alphaproteobacteria bacterium]|nr:flagellar motor switch protein FliG [Alphaproteobacteria bacterium]
MNIEHEDSLQSPSLQETEKNHAALSGPERAAILMFAVGRQSGKKIWELLSSAELRILSSAMSHLGTINSSTVETLLIEFTSKLPSSGGLTGTFDSTERLLKEILTEERATTLMAEVRLHTGRNMWEKLSNVEESILANYLKNEYPQTVAVILSRIKTESTARVLSLFPENFSIEVIQRMLNMEPVQKEIIEKVEQTLDLEFMSNLTLTKGSDTLEMVVEIFNEFDRKTETRFMNNLSANNPEIAEQIRALMFTFDDLEILDKNSLQILLRSLDKKVLAIALKGASETLRDLFFSSMSNRAQKTLRGDMEIMGPVRLDTVDETQAKVVSIARKLADEGKITISKNETNEQMVY